MTELTAQEWIDKYGVENALANLAPYHENEMLFIIPRDVLDEVVSILADKLLPF